MKALQADGELLNQIKTELVRASKFYFGMALVTKSGLDLLHPSIEHFLERGGHGSVLFGIDLPTEPAAIESLCAIQRQHQWTFELRRFQPGRTFFHPKLSIFGTKTGARTAIIGSSNMTGGGFSGNFETNVLVDERNVAQQFLDYFEEHFQGAHAKSVDQTWLDQYWRLWKEREKTERHQQRLLKRVQGLSGPPPNIPKGIKGHTFVFTGRIADWPRLSRLYPYVKRHGGFIAAAADTMKSADCLIHAEIMGGRKSTKKLEKARKLKIPIITEEQFFKLAGIKHT